MKCPSPETRIPHNAAIGLKPLRSMPGRRALMRERLARALPLKPKAPALKRGTGLLRDPEDLRKRWESVQVGFVDNPREAVGEAENLVSSAIGEIAGQFRQQRERLEASWDQGRDPSTDDLRIVFQGYRDFFGRLLQV